MRSREQAVIRSSRVVRGIARRAHVAVESRSAADLVVAQLLTDPRCQRLADPVAFVGFLREAFEPSECAVDTLVSVSEPRDEAALRFSTLLGQLTGGLPPLAIANATAIGLRADELSALRDPFDRPHLSIDVGLHARTASSFARKGRILAAIVRFMRTEHVLEIGTAYGMSALFLAQELDRRGGRLTTLERSHPQVDVATRVLADAHPETVRVVGGVSDDLDASLGEERYQFLFHDAEHSETAYIRDFETFAHRLEPGAVVLYDDIRWEDPHRADPARTYEGWQAVVAHERVRAAVEVDGLYGLLLLR